MKQKLCIQFWLASLAVLQSLVLSFTAQSLTSRQVHAPVTGGRNQPTWSGAVTSAASQQHFMVASSSTQEQVASMPRGMDGRIENAFAQAKERGEAAFVTFVTAGYPTKEGKFESETLKPLVP